MVSAYEIYMVANRGATLGKMALGIKVVKDDGITAVDMNDAVRRMAIYIILGVLGALTAAGTFEVLLINGGGAIALMAFLPAIVNKPGFGSLVTSIFESPSMRPAP